MVTTSTALTFTEDRQRRILPYTRLVSIIETDREQVWIPTVTCVDSSALSDVAVTRDGTIGQGITTSEGSAQEPTDPGQVASYLAADSDNTIQLTWDYQAASGNSTITLVAAYSQLPFPASSTENTTSVPWTSVGTSESNFAFDVWSEDTQMSGTRTRERYYVSSARTSNIGAFWHDPSYDYNPSEYPFAYFLTDAARSEYLYGYETETIFDSTIPMLAQYETDGYTANAHWAFTVTADTETPLLIVASGGAAQLRMFSPVFNRGLRLSGNSQDASVFSDVTGTFSHSEMIWMSDSSINSADSSRSDSSDYTYETSVTGYTIERSWVPLPNVWSLGMDGRVSIMPASGSVAAVAYTDDDYDGYEGETWSYAMETTWSVSSIWSGDTSHSNSTDYTYETSETVYPPAYHVTRWFKASFDNATYRPASFLRFAISISGSGDVGTGWMEIRDAASGGWWHYHPFDMDATWIPGQHGYLADPPMILSAAADVIMIDAAGDTQLFEAGTHEATFTQGFETVSSAMVGPAGARWLTVPPFFETSEFLVFLADSGGGQSPPWYSPYTRTVW
jgi:hypothetical protein